MQNNMRQMLRQKKKQEIHDGLKEISQNTLQVNLDEDTTLVKKIINAMNNGYQHNLKIACKNQEFITKMIECQSSSEVSKNQSTPNISQISFGPGEIEPDSLAIFFDSFKLSVASFTLYDNDAQNVMQTLHDSVWFHQLLKKNNPNTFNYPLLHIDLTKVTSLSPYVSLLQDIKKLGCKFIIDIDLNLISQLPGELGDFAPITLLKLWDIDELIIQTEELASRTLKNHAITTLDIQKYEELKNEILGDNSNKIKSSLFSPLKMQID